MAINDLILHYYKICYQFVTYLILFPSCAIFCFIEILNFIKKYFLILSIVYGFKQSIFVRNVVIFLFKIFKIISISIALKKKKDKTQ